MYRIKKVLNHNTVIAVNVGENREYLIMQKGVAFGKKADECIEIQNDSSIYSLQETTERGSVQSIVRSVEPTFLEIADAILAQAEKVFSDLDKNILFPMADHLEYAVKRMRNNEQIHNPLTDDIRVLFYAEFKTAECVRDILKNKFSVNITDDEIGYIALHIHSALQKENVSQAMQIARAVRECISLVEKETGKKIDVLSFSYNRLMNHIRNMVLRTINGEKLKLNMNDYMVVKLPKAFRTAQYICEQIEKSIKSSIDIAEIGYLAMHIERVESDEE